MASRRCRNHTRVTGTVPSEPGVPAPAGLATMTALASDSDSPADLHDHGGRGAAAPGPGRGRSRPGRPGSPAPEAGAASCQRDFKLTVASPGQANGRAGSDSWHQVENLLVNSLIAILSESELARLELCVTGRLQCPWHGVTLSQRMRSDR